MRLIHITDPHLTSLATVRFRSLRGKRCSGYLSWRKSRQHRHRPEILARLARSVLSESPDRILLTGDLMHIGLDREAKEAQDWLQGLGPPGLVHLIPGNHDIYAADSAAAIARHWGAYLPNDGFPFVKDIGDVRVTGLNSAVATTIFSARGELGSAQLSALPKILLPDRFNVVLIHHPPLPGMTKWRKSLRDAGALREIFGRCAPDLVLYGHVHRNQDSRLGGSRMFATASASGQQDAAYRVFDITGGAGRWTVEMQLKTLAPGFGSADKNDFAVSGRESWDITRHTEG
jgi:3',5'-cyclic AMP phosphodiesterase CpdA